MRHPERGSPPRPVRDDRGWDELDDYVLAFEEAYHDQGEADPAAFLPPTDHPLHRAVLLELVRVDLEFGWGRGRPKSLQAYQDTFPQLLEDQAGLSAIAFEEYRLRRAAGQAPSADEYRRRYGLAFEPRSERVSSYLSGRTKPEGASDADRGTPRGAVSPSGGARSGGAGHPRSMPRLPDVGDDFLGFRLTGELGRGSFGRVYLARQAALANRMVVLKVSADRHDESQTLAKLQHDYIVPIHSEHNTGALRAVCMPFLGSVTLRDVLAELKSRNATPGTGRDLLSGLSRSSERKVLPGPDVGTGPAVAGGAAPGGSVDSSGSHGRVVAGMGVRGGASLSAAAGGSSAVSPWSLSAMSSRLERLWARRPESVGAGGGAGASAGSGATVSAGATAGAWQGLARLSYVEAVVWMLARLARGLAHAHERGILHHDLKPANILLADDGRPLLLDFNLAADLTKSDESDGSMTGALGGTLPYMAPEHLDAFRRGTREAEQAVDARSDVYALGVIFYEMLTGHLPFPARQVVAGDREALRTMIADRRSGSPPVRPYNPAVSPGVESIVRHCLEPAVDRRYASAEELAEDLERHLAHQPLLHAADPSREERVVKWMKRNRGPLLVGTALIGLLTLSVVLTMYRNRVASGEAVSALARFEARAADARNRLGVVQATARQERAAVAAAGEALDEFHAREAGRTAWWGLPPASLLPGDQRQRLRNEAGELFLILARGEAGSLTGIAGPSLRDRLEAALDANLRAEAAFGATAQPKYLWLQRAALLQALGDNAGAGAARATADRHAELSPRDYVFSAQERLINGRPLDALPLFDEALRRDRRDYWAWLGKGQALWLIRDVAGASACYELCVALAPENPSAWFNLGLVHLSEGRFELAADDFGQALKARPDDPEALYNRALADLQRGQLPAAEAGLTRALERGLSPTRVHLARWRVRTRLGDRAGATHDLNEGLRRTPEPDDPLGWVSRGYAHAETGNLASALADQDRALAIAPHHHEALRNKAVVLSRLHRDDDALATLDHVLEQYPSDDDARMGRAVLLARLGRRDAALADTQRVLESKRKPTPIRLLQAASAYAQTSRTHPTDRQEALRLLEAVVRNGGVRPEELANDSDFAPLHVDPAFGRLVADAESTSLARHRRDAAAGPARLPAGRSTTDRHGAPPKVHTP